MECLIGIATKEFCIIAADSRSSRSIITMKHDQDKMFQLSSRILAAACGESGDATHFAQFIEQNMQLYEIRHGYELSPSGAANFTRSNLANALRSRKPYNVNMILAGYDDNNGPELYYLDYLASLVKAPFVVHGYGSYLALSLLDRQYRPDMNVAEATELLRTCIKVISKRFVVNLDRYTVRLVTKDGIEQLPELTSAEA